MSQTKLKTVRKVKVKISEPRYFKDKEDGSESIIHKTQYLEKEIPDDVVSKKEIYEWVLTSERGNFRNVKEIKILKPEYYLE